MLNIEEHEELRRYLSTSGHISGDEALSFDNLAGGVSCRTVLVTRSDGPDLVLKQALEYLRVAEVWKGDPTRVAREAEAMRVLNELLTPGQVPELVFEDDSIHLIAMTAVAQPHENWKTMLLRGEISEVLVEQFGSMLGTIHRESWRRQSELSNRFDDRTQFETLRIDPYYRFTAEKLPETAAWIDQLITDTVNVREALVHGDYSPKNVLIQQHSCVLLDHEVAHWGDPAFDTGFASAHFLGKANHSFKHRREFADAAQLFWRSYRREVEGLDWFGDMASRSVRHVIACTLARVSGKSQLEYLSDDQRDRQRRAAIRLADDEPPDYDTLVDRFLEMIS